MNKKRVAKKKKKIVAKKKADKKKVSKVFLTLDECSICCASKMVMGTDYDDVLDNYICLECYHKTVKVFGGFISENPEITKKLKKYGESKLISKRLENELINLSSSNRDDDGDEDDD